MRRVAIFGLVVWAGLGVLLGGLLLVHHLVALPAPLPSDPALRDAIAALHPARPGWRAVHFLYRSCGCSKRTITHLEDTAAAAARPGDLDEVVVMVDDDGAAGPQDAPLRAAGFDVEVITPRALHDRFHVQAAPLLAIAAPDHALAYVGGYNRHSQSADYEDLAIVDDVRAHAARAPLPVFGCATSAQLADALDPLGLRRW